MPQNLPPCPDSSPQTSESPRWSHLEQPRIQGFATYEWNIATGTCWYSPEWNAITQSDDYDPDIPDNQEWWLPRLHPDDTGLLQRSLLAVCTGFLDESDARLRLKRKDGTWRWLYIRCRVTEKNADGSPLIACGICLDITDALPGGLGLHGQASVSETEYHSMLENSPDLFIRFNRELSPVYVNPAIARYLGSTREEFAHTGLLKDMRITGDYKELLRKNIERVFRERNAVREELTLTMSDGSDVSGEAAFWPEFDAEGNVLYVVAQFRDLTEQRRMQQRVTLEEQRLEALYKLTLMEGASETEVLEFVMASVLKLTKSRSGFFFIPEEEGSTKGYLLWSGDHYGFLEPHHMPDDRLPRDLLIQMRSGDSSRTYRSINNGDGITPLYVVFDQRMSVMRGIIAPGMEDKRVVCVAGVCNKDSDYDESDLQQLETFINSAWLILRRRRFVQELQQAKEAAEAANRAKNIFLANVSHELRTPLHGVLSMLQLIDGLHLGKQQREYLLTAQFSGKALLRIISDLLDFSYMESGKMPLDADEFNFEECVRSAVDMFEDDAAKQGLEIRVSMDTSIPSLFVGDEARVRQVIFNVMGNALKFTREGAIQICCSRLPDDSQGKVGVELLVSDTGIGIPSDKLDSIFEAFTQLENAHRRRYSGTGLGLSIVKHLVSMMDGEISVASQPGKGSTVRCTLYFAEAEASTVAPHAAVQRSEGAVNAAPRPLDVLVAEDDSVGSLAIRAFLECMGHRVFCVDDGQQALEALQLHPFHCLFTDIEMPYMDGVELVRRIRSGDAVKFSPSDEIRLRLRAAFPEEPDAATAVATDMLIAAVSAHSMIGDRERFLKLGMDYYVSKPIIRKELEDVMQLIAGRLEEKRTAQPTE